jgi:phosphatidate cytidylyltransferase
MAFNWQTFRTRALTAIVFVVVMLVGLLYNRWSFFLLFSVVHFGAWWEYQKLVAQFYPPYRQTGTAHKILAMLAGWMLMFFFTHDTLQVAGIHLQQAGLWLGLIFAVLIPVSDVLRGRLMMGSLGYTLAGLLYVSLSLALLINLRNRFNEAQYQLSLTLPLLTIFSLWINDTMAYIVGSIIGKTPLSKISPKKTWEGTIGGVMLTIVVISLLAHWTHRLDLVNAGILAGLAAIVGTFGDLFESKLKRMAGVKDSGQIMPGHGGFLDRFDSLLFAAPVVWLYAALVL